MIWAIFTIHLLLFPLWLLLLCPVSIHLCFNHTGIIKLDLSLYWKTFGSTSYTLSGVLVRKYQRELNRNDCNVHLNCGAKCRRLVLSIWVFQFALHLSWEEIGNPTHPLVKLKMINFKFLFLPQFRNQLLLPLWETFRKVETLCWLLADLNTAVSAGILTDITFFLCVFFYLLITLKAWEGWVKKPLLPRSLQWEPAFEGAGSPPQARIFS